MDFNRIKILMISLFIFTLCSLLFYYPAYSASRGISIISDLSHQSGKLGAYRALIIGINDYKDPKIPDLKTAVNDAKAVSELLRDHYGFKVKLILNQEATKEAIYQALRSLASSTKPDDSVLIYYAGHGDLDRTFNDGWWIPVDAKGGNPVTYLDNTQVQKAMRSMQARHVLLISDSCYSGTLFGDARAMPPVIDDKYYLSLYNDKSRWGMTSGNKTPVSDTGSGGHSVFAYQLLKELRNNEKPYVSTQELYTRIAPIVGNNSEQSPLCRPIRNTGDQGGEFVFVASRGADIEKPVPVKPEPIVMPGQTETVFDDILKASEDKRKAVESWDQWQQTREHEYRQVKKIDKDSYLSSEQKVAAWQRFLAAVSQENPYSQQDDEMRSDSRSRLNHWQSVKPLVTKPIPSSFDVYEEKEAGRDGTFIAYATGMVYDKNTGLEWFAGPDRNTNWNDAKVWVENLNVAGGGWRLPTREELKTLYQKGAGKRNMTSLLKITGWWVWGEARDSSSAWYFYFANGSEGWGIRDSSYYDGRGFAVRSRRQ
ncbi:MAG: caspase family protein [Desulfobacteraceae bacterium]|nr:caspase family protein [Desulfobacteraceae bacterium]